MNEVYDFTNTLFDLTVVRQEQTLFEFLAVFSKEQYTYF